MLSYEWYRIVVPCKVMSIVPSQKEVSYICTVTIYATTGHPFRYKWVGSSGNIIFVVYDMCHSCMSRTWGLKASIQSKVVIASQSTVRIYKEHMFGNRYLVEALGLKSTPQPGNGIVDNTTFTVLSLPKCNKYVVICPTVMLVFIFQWVTRVVYDGS